MDDTADPPHHNPKNSLAHTGEEHRRRQEPTSTGRISSTVLNGAWVSHRIPFRSVSSLVVLPRLWCPVFLLRVRWTFFSLCVRGPVFSLRVRNLIFLLCVWGLVFLFSRSAPRHMTRITDGLRAQNSLCKDYRALRLSKKERGILIIFLRSCHR